MTKRHAIIKNFGKFIFLMKSWSLKLKTIQSPIKKSQHNYKYYKMLRNNGVSFGFKNQEKKSEELLIWLINPINVLLVSAPNLMDQMYHWICILRSSIIVGLRLKGKLWQNKSALGSKKVTKFKWLSIFLQDICRNLEKSSESMGQ